MKLVLPVAVALALLLAVSDLMAQSSISEDIVACYDLEEATGTREDATGRFSLTDNNTVNSANGLVGYAGDFVKANSEFLSHADHPALAGTNKTFMSWVRFDDTTLQGIFGRYGYGSNEYLLYISGSTVEYQWYKSAVKYTINQNVGLVADTWYMFTVWQSPVSDTMNLTVNDGTIYSTAFTGTVDAAGSLFTLGKGAWHLNGLIDTFTMWDRELTSDERTWLYNAGVGRSCAEILGTAGTTYAVDLPSGGTGTVDMSVTAGDVGIMSGLVFLSLLAVFHLIRRTVLVTRASKQHE